MSDRRVDRDAAARGSALCFVDGDCIVPGDYLVRVAAVLCDGRVDAAGCPVRPAPGGSWIPHAWADLRRSSVREPMLIPGANFTISRAAFEPVGGFDERLESYEDVDLCLRLRDSGRTIVVDRSLESIHLDEPQSAAAFARREFRYGLGAFSRVRLARVERTSSAAAVHLFLGLACLALAVARVLSWWAWAVAALAAAAAVPVAAVAARGAAGARVGIPLRALWLYSLHFLGRSAALVWTFARLTKRVVRSPRTQGKPPVPTPGAASAAPPAEGPAGPPR